MIAANQIEKNWVNLKERIKNQNGDLNKIKVIPVTKYVGAEEVNALISLGFDQFGENRIDVLKEKIILVPSKNIKWDFIGNIQSRKIPEILAHANLIHSVGNLDIVNKINNCASQTNKIAKILIQVNVAEEPQKGGFSINEIKKQFASFLKLNSIKIVGLMAMAPQTEDLKLIRKTFNGLRELKDLLKKEAYPEFNELSMGMSEDFEIAIQEGATILRIGSLFFKENEK